MSSNPAQVIWGPLARSRRAIAVAIGLFCLGSLMSLVVAPTSTGVSLEPRPAISLLSHNLEATAFLWSGVLTLGVSSAGGAVLNGYAVGVGLVAPDVPLATRLALFVPHAIIELPALWLAGAAGFRIPEAVAHYLAGAADHPIPDTATHDTLVLVAWSVALVSVAAVVESTVTPVVGRLVA